jgi:hypothetical protein
MKFVSDNSKEFEQRRCRERVENALRKMTANLLRIARGGGRPHEIADQSLELLEACREFHEQVGYFPAAEFPQMLNTAPDSDAPEFRYAVHAVVCGALQVTASRLLDQKTQLTAGAHALYEGIRYLKEVRAARHARGKGRRNE